MGQRGGIVTGTADPKPIPVPDELSEGFWSAASEHRLSVQQCESCGWLAYPPNIACINCLVDPPRFGWHDVSGAGRLKTWTVVRDAFLPGFADAVPYVIADVELVEQPGLRILARLEGVDHDELARELAVEVAFTDLSSEALPYFVASSS